MENRAMGRLIECPFCESNMQKIILDMKVISDTEWTTKGWFVECECGARTGHEKEQRDAEARWNRDYEYFIKKDGTPNLFTVKFIAYTKGYRGYTGEEQYEFEAEDLQDARHWIINHLDCSCEWNVREL